MLLLVLLSAYICMGLCGPPAEVEHKSYGDSFYWRLPQEAENLEFIPQDSYEDNKVVLWRRSDSTAGEGGRGSVRGRRWVMEKLTQSDNGIYNLRNQFGRVIQSKRIIVAEDFSHVDGMEGEDVTMIFNLDLASSNVRFIPEDEAMGYTHRMISRGHLVSGSFEDRIQLSSDEDSFELLISDLKASDAGTFQLEDLKGNIVRKVVLAVETSAPLSVNVIGVAVGTIIVVIVCCCCVRKCCCKKSSTKTETAAAPAVYHHDTSSEPARPIYQPPARTYHTPTYPNRPAGSAYPSGPSYSGSSSGFRSPLVHNPTDINVTSPQPEVPATAGEGAALTDSDSGPRFEVKGLTSAPPLSSDVSICDVYTSDKLNFL